jgi:endonuclease/exonuclease/phosphatase family metal-dependent hydrolase
MNTLQSRRIAPGKRFTVFITASVLIAVIFGLNTPAWAEGRDIGGKRDIDVATFNLYVGADLSPLLALNPSDPQYFSKLIAGVAALHAQVLQSNFPVRAEALAEQIVRRAPDLVALQEVSLIRRQSPGDLIVGGTTRATDVELDYLAILLDALERHGGHYAVASQVQDTDVELPLFTGTSFDDIRLTDRDVILVRTDLPPGHLNISNPQGRNFTAALPLPTGAYVLRGWCSIDVQTRGRFFRFIDTHLEDVLPRGLPNLQLAQAYELLAVPANTTMPVILSGDFNSDAYGYYSPETYSLITGPGHFTDAWTVAEPRRLGLTWGHDPFLSDVTVPFVFRLDLTLYRGREFEATEADVIDPVIGQHAPLWFSDHAGVTATMAIH